MRFRSLAPLLVCFVLSGCSTEENAVRSAVQEVFAAAKRGDIAFALDRMDSANPLSAILQYVQSDQGEDAYNEALAELGGRSREALEGKTLRIESVEINGDRAVAHCIIVENGRDIRGEAVVSRIGGEWRPYSLPGLPKTSVDQ